MGDLEIPTTNSLSLFKRALAVPNHYTLSDIVNQGLVKHINVSQEAVAYRSDSIHMVELKYGHHNNSKFKNIILKTINN